MQKEKITEKMYVIVDNSLVLLLSYCSSEMILTLKISFSDSFN